MGEKREGYLELYAPIRITLVDFENENASKALYIPLHAACKDQS